MQPSLPHLHSLGITTNCFFLSAILVYVIFLDILDISYVLVIQPHKVYIVIHSEILCETGTGLVLQEQNKRSKDEEKNLSHKGHQKTKGTDSPYKILFPTEINGDVTESDVTSQYFKIPNLAVNYSHFVLVAV